MNSTAIINTEDPRELELFQLQKEYRIMEQNRRHYAEESQSLLRNQQQTINKLRRDNEELKGNIAIAMRNPANSLTANRQEMLHKLHETGDKYATMIDQERNNIATFEEQIAILKQKVLHQRKNMGGINASKDNYFMIQKQIRILENRLDKALVKFNEAISHNKDLRDSIDDLRRERVVFENIYKKMERELQERKQNMAEIIEVSNQSYEQRDAYQMEIAAVEQANRKEHEEYGDQIRELTRMLETDLKLPAPSASRAGTLSSSGRRSMLGSGGLQTGELGATSNSANMADFGANERIQNFEEAFNKIKAATGITDIEELVRAFIKNEDHNFSLFNYVNEQNNEIEKLDEQIIVLKEEEKHYAQETGEDAVAHKQILRELEVKLATTEGMAEKYEKRGLDLQRIIESLKRGIQSVYDRLEIGGEEDINTGSSETLITESNMVHFLGLIEQKSNQILARYTEIRQNLLRPVKESSDALVVPSKAQLNKSVVAVLGTGPKVPMGQDHVHVNPPKLDDYQSDDDEVDEADGDAFRPLTHDELKNRTLNRLARRTGGNENAGGGKKKGH